MEADLEEAVSGGCRWIGLPGRALSPRTLPDLATYAKRWGLQYVLSLDEAPDWMRQDSLRRQRLDEPMLVYYEDRTRDWINLVLGSEGGLLACAVAGDGHAG